ncbi:MAG: glutaredoxin domain-containing protein [Spirochaeta sp.]|jgi:glutaredoxin 3|nr:glutaredoxin domain-containing protein [Spirochaeta sp.]
MAVTVYTTPTCSFCNKVKKYLKQNRVTFKEHNIARDKRKAEEMVKKSGQMGVPVLDVHGKIIVGFDVNKIEQALRR